MQIKTHFLGFDKKEEINCAESKWMNTNINIAEQTATWVVANGWVGSNLDGLKMGQFNMGNNLNRSYSIWVKKDGKITWITAF